MTKDERQDIGVEKYISAGAKGTAVYPTSFGKTIFAIKIIKALRRTKTWREVIIVVPTIPLHDQWLTILFEHGLMDFTKVVVINTAIKSKQKCSLLVIDEIHRTGADTFRQVFESIEYQFILGLTATLERSDKKHEIIKKHCPVFDKISVAEARANKWMAPYTEYNLGIQLSASAMSEYLKLEEEYERIMNYFMRNFRAMQECINSFKPIEVTHDRLGNKLAIPVYKDSSCSALARSYGWKGKTPYSAYLDMKSKVKDVWGGDPTHPYNPRVVQIMAINGMRVIRKIKEFIESQPEKLNAALEIMKKMPVKTITFSGTIEKANNLTHAINSMYPSEFPGQAMSYHSDIKGTVDPSTGKKLSAKKVRSEMLDDIRKSPKYLVINTSKALDEGFDYPELIMGIALDRDGVKRQHIQRRGRPTRPFVFDDGTEKHAFFINIYLKGTKDEDRLRKAQDNDPFVIWVESINEIDFT